MRQLRWSDVGLERGIILWRREPDKIGFEHSTPITDVALDALSRALSAHPKIAAGWVFPAPGDPSQPLSRHLVRDWWERLAAPATLPKGQRYGWHSLRRKFASEMKATPLLDLAHLGGWKSAQTILTCYQMPHEATQREALLQRRSLHTTRLS